MFQRRHRYSTNPDLAGNATISPSRDRLLFTWMHAETKQKITAKCVADFSDATTLNQMVDQLILKVPLQDWNMHPANKVQREKNTEKALEKMKHAGIFTNLRVKDILRGDDQRVIQLLEDVFKFVMKSKLCQVMKIGRQDVYAAFRDWINDQLKPVMRIHNFSDYWSSGKALAGLVNKLTGCLPDWMNWLDTGEEDHVEQAMTIAEEYGVQKWLHVAEIVQCKSDDDATPNIIYLSQFLNIALVRDTRPKSINHVQGIESSSLEGRQSMIVPMRNAVQYMPYRNSQPPEHSPKAVQVTARSPQGGPQGQEPFSRPNQPEYTRQELDCQSEGPAYAELQPDASINPVQIASSTASRCIHQPQPDAFNNPVRGHSSRYPISHRYSQESFHQAQSAMRPEAQSSRPSYHIRSHSETHTRDNLFMEEECEHADSREIIYRPTSNVPGIAMRQTRIMQPRNAQMSMMGRGVRSIPPPEYSPNEFLPMNRPQGEILYTGQRQSLYLGEQAAAYDPRQSTFMEPSVNQQIAWSGRQSQSGGRPSVAFTRSCNNDDADQESMSAVRKIDEDVDLRSVIFHKPVSEEELWKQIPEHIQSNIRQPLEDMMVKGKLFVINELHNGKFCRVYKIRFTHYLYGYQKLAAKTFKVSGNMVVKTVVDLLAEAEMMLHFKHDNVLEMSGFTFHEGLPYIMMPLMTNGDLHSYLINEDNRNSVEDLNKFQMGVAAGMHYLHEQCGFVHRNLRTSNCLLDDGLNVKISNFHLARPTMVADEDYVVVAGVMKDMPWRWMPPEILESYNNLESEHISFNFKTDTWQFGICCWEIDSYGEVPYSNMQTVQEVINYLKSGERLPQPEMMSDTKFEKIIWPCWYPNPEHRPNLGKIEKLLDCEDRMTKMYTELQDNALYDDIEQRRVDQNLTQPKPRLSETPV